MPADPPGDLSGDSARDASGESSRDRLVTAAFGLFEERGFEGTTVEDIARRAGVGRTTFFRNFAAKEDAIFPRHEELLTRIGQRLAASAPSTRGVAVIEAARLVLLDYLREGERARARYRLTSTIPALRAREVAGIRQYQQLFARFLRQWWAGEPDGPLRADLLAAAVVTAHNHVLRRWLRGESAEPEQEFAHAMTLVLDRSSGQEVSGSHDDTAVVVLRATGSVEVIARRLQRALADGGGRE